MRRLSGIKELHRSRELFWLWIQRDIRTRYKQSFFGFAWAVFQPLALTIVFVVVFSRIVRMPSDGLPYPIFAFAALLPWTFFARGVAVGALSIVGNMNLITKARLPRLIFPLGAIAVHFVDYLCGLVIFAGLMLFYSFPLTPAVLLVPGLLAVQVMFMIGITAGAAALNVHYRDVGQATPLLLQIWMYACPIIYPLSMVPESLRPWYLLNPMAGLIVSYRMIFLAGEVPDATILVPTIVVSTIVAVIGLVIFKHLEPTFADII